MLFIITCIQQDAFLDGNFEVGSCLDPTGSQLGWMESLSYKQTHVLKTIVLERMRSSTSMDALKEVPNAVMALFGQLGGTFITSGISKARLDDLTSALSEMGDSEWEAVTEYVQEG